mgnify:CR=1 FL=1
MIRALSTAAAGMQAEQMKLDVTANNIANVSNVGYKRSRAEFQDLIYQTIREPGTPTAAGTQSATGLQVGTGVRTVSTQRIHSQGSFRQTGNPLDVAIEGNGFFQINLPDGSTGYTRDGELRMNSEGRLVTSDGFTLTSEIAVPPDSTTISVAADGTVSVSIPGNPAPVEVGNIELATFANPSGLSSAGRNILRETSASGAAVSGRPGDAGIGMLSQGALETSNVQIVDEMIDMITGQRAYELNSKVIQAADEMLTTASRLR